MASNPKDTSWLASVSAHSFEGPNGEGPLRTVIARGRALSEEVEHVRAAVVSPHITEDQIEDMARENLMRRENAYLKVRVAELETDLRRALEMPVITYKVQSESGEGES